MYFPLTLDSKRKFTRPDNETLVDLTQQTLKYKAEHVTISNTIACSKDMAMRVDFISQLVYNTSDKTEYILKFNGISNPFSVDEGDTIMLPDSFNARSHFKIVSKYEEMRNNVRKQFIDESKMTTKDNTLSEFEQRKAVGLPPNYAKEGDKEIVIKNGIIKFGPNISKTQKTTNVNDSSLTSERRDFLNRMKKLNG